MSGRAERSSAALDASRGALLTPPQAALLEAARLLAPRLFDTNLERDELEGLKKGFPTLALEHVTAHASKRREADYVVVLALENKRFGFPNRKESEELIELVLLGKGQSCRYTRNV